MELEQVTVKLIFCLASPASLALHCRMLPDPHVLPLFVILVCGWRGRQYLAGGWSNPPSFTFYIKCKIGQRSQASLFCKKDENYRILLHVIGFCMFIGFTVASLQLRAHDYVFSAPQSALEILCRPFKLNYAIAPYKNCHNTPRAWNQIWFFKTYFEIFFLKLIE